MNKQIVTVLLCCIFVLAASRQELRLTKDMVIKQSAKIKRQQYNLSSVGSHQPAIIIHGDNIVLDFNQAVLNGNSALAKPDAFTGIAIEIRQSKNVTIRNLNAKGFKVAISAESVENLVIEHCDFSYNYRPHLPSLSIKKANIESIPSIEASLSQGGAAIMLKACNNSKIANNKVNNGQNALVLLQSNDGLIYNNDFSFNSGVALQLYQSSRNKVLYNRMVFNIRSQENKAETGAGMHVMLGSTDNLFFRNAVTHNGMGIHLYDQTTGGDTTAGGNILNSNDFSFATVAGIFTEENGSSFYNNRIFECENGLRGINISKVKIGGNQFRNNRAAININNGQQVSIHHNLFIRDAIAIRLQGAGVETIAPAQFSDRKASRGYILAANSFNKNDTVFHLADTDSIAVFSNRYDSEVIFETKAGVTNIDREYNDSQLLVLSEDIEIDTPSVEKPMNPFKGLGKWSGRQNIHYS
ncbi:MAG TPA: right-handed parallel beta-helix repeat-containing protein, partial [Flavisolibacter sp.]|nr:right-handed parallel beta-helix repeat-containing protein [Flavisolibacter sp.]